MSKKLSWLDKFAQEQAAKLTKVASTRVAEQAIIDPTDLPDAQNGQVVEYLGEKYKVVDAGYEDNVGRGVLVEKVAALDAEVTDETATDVPAIDATEVAPVAPVDPMATAPTVPTGGQQYSYTKLPIQETYNNDQDAQWGTSSAAGTAQEIAAEDAVDRTTVPGHFTKSIGVNSGMGAPVGGTDTTVPGQVPAAHGITPAEQVMDADTTVPGVATTNTPAEQVMNADTTVPGVATTNTPADNIYEGAAPVAVSTTTEEVAPVVDENTAVTTETAETADADVADKMASNRIFARMFKGSK